MFERSKQRSYWLNGPQADGPLHALVVSLCRITKTQSLSWRLPLKRPEAQRWMRRFIHTQKPRVGSGASTHIRTRSMMTDVSLTKFSEGKVQHWFTTFTRTGTKQKNLKKWFLEIHHTLICIQTRNSGWWWWWKSTLLFMEQHN